MASPVCLFVPDAAGPFRRPVPAGTRNEHDEPHRMKRPLFAIALALTAVLPSQAQARVVHSSCVGRIHPSGPHHCTFIFGGPVLVSGTAAPGADGRAEIHLVLEFDPRGINGVRLLPEPMFLAECRAEAVGEPASCSAEWHGDYARLGTPSLVRQSAGQSLPGRCTGVGTAGTFTCEGGTA